MSPNQHSSVTRAVYSANSHQNEKKMKASISQIEILKELLKLNQ